MRRAGKLYIPAVVFLAAVFFFKATRGISFALPTVERTVTEKRLTVLLSEDHSLPFVTIQLLVDAGSRRDPAGQDGLARLTAKGLLLGTSRIKAASINEELDFMGASLSASANRDYSSINLRVLKKDLEKALDLFADILTAPVFPEEEVRKEVDSTVAAIRAAEDDPEDVAEKAFAKTLFSKGPYGHPVEGTKESVAKLRGGDLATFYSEYYHPNNAILVVVGDMTMKEVNAMLLPRLSRWAPAQIPPEAFDRSYAEEPETVKIDRNITQANVIIGQQGVSRENPDYYALSVMNYILGGGGFASRLTEEIRNKRGLAYAVDSFFDPGRYPGSFQIVLQTKNATAREAIAISRDQLELIRKEPVSDKELDDAKKYLTGSFPMRFDTQGKLVNFLSQVEYYRLGLDYPKRYPSIIRGISKEQVLSVARKYLHPDKAVLVIVGDLKEAGME
jgi:zinc protease